MSLHFDTSACFADTIGGAGLPRARFTPLAERAGAALADIGAKIAHPDYAPLAWARRGDDLPGLERHARHLGTLSDVIAIGIGGSSLGTRTLLAALPLPPGRARIHCVEGLMPNAVDQLMASVNPATTGLLLISKSGSTVEVMVQALALIPRLLAGGANLARTGIAIVAPGNTPLHKLAAHHGMTVLEHPPTVGGRYSVLSITGVLPALIAGLDAAALRRGAAAELDRALTEGAASAPAQGAALSVGLQRECQVGTSVLMAYDDRLDSFGLWFRQLWAESLGKEGQGTTPVRALGPVDQHSQVQLYLGGPADKLFTIVTVESMGQGPRIAARDIDPSLAYIDGATVGDVLAYSARATAETLAKHGRPVRRVHLARLDAESLGAFFMHYMLETILTARLLDVDPFDQPAVDEGKQLARDYLAAAQRR